MPLTSENKHENKTKRRHSYKKQKSRHFHVNDNHTTHTIDIITGMFCLGIFMSFVFQIQICSTFLNISPSVTHIVKCRRSPRLVVIKGERHSGTNWVRVMIDMNSDRLLKGHDVSDENDIDSAIIGWKHGLIDPYYGTDTEQKVHYEIPQLPASDVMLVVGRDAFVWVLHMQKETYDGSIRKMNYLEGFLQQEIQPLRKGKDDHEKRGYRNIIEMRTVKYNEWLTEEPHPKWMVKRNPANVKCTIQEKRSYVRYEDLVAHEDAPKTILNHFFYKMCIPKHKEFKTHNDYASWNRQKTVKNSYIQQNSKKFAVNRNLEKDLKYNWDTLEKYTIEEMQYVLSELDLEFEQEVLGYNYSYVTKYIEMRRKNFPGTEYTGNSKRKKQVVDFDAQKKKIGTRDNKDKRPQNNRDNINNRNTHEKKPMRKPNEYKNKIEPRAQNTNNNVNHHIYRYHDGFRVPN